MTLRFGNMKIVLVDKHDNIGNELFLQNLYKSTLHFLNPRTVEETYHIIGNEAIRLFECQYASIFVKDGRKLERVWDSSEKMFRVSEDKRRFAAKSLKAGEPAVISASKLIALHPNILDWGIKSVIFVPLYYRGSRMGYIALDSLSEVKKLSKNQRSSLKIFGSFAMMAIRKAQLHNQLEDSLNTRDLFISMASHELKSPLTTINSYSQLIERTVALGKKPEYRWSKVLRDETVRLVHMFDELLQLDSIKAGKLQYTWRIFDLDEVIKRAITNFKVGFPQRLLIYENKLKKHSGEVMGDFDKLLQAFLNVFNNAAKFSEREIKVRLYSTKPYYVITVEDFGVGIPNSDSKHIFRGFYKGKNSHRQGIGLGLFLTKSIVEMHRGKLEAVSDSISTKVNFYLPKMHSKKV